ELRRQEVRHDREELPDLDEQPLQSQDRRIDATSVGLVRETDVSVAPAPPVEPGADRQPKVARDDRESRRVRSHEPPAPYRGAPMRVPDLFGRRGRRRTSPRGADRRGGLAW